MVRKVRQIQKKEKNLGLISPTAAPEIDTRVSMNQKFVSITLEGVRGKLEWEVKSNVRSILSS